MSEMVKWWKGGRVRTEADGDVCQSQGLEAVADTIAEKLMGLKDELRDKPAHYRYVMDSARQFISILDSITMILKLTQGEEE